MNTISLRTAIAALLLFTSAGCATREGATVPKIAGRELKQARSTRLPPEQRAALYLNAAAATAPLPGRPDSPLDRAIYNAAAGELTSLLRTADGGQLWNRPLTLSSGTSAYHLQIANGAGKGLCAPGEFTSFVPADKVRQKNLRKRNVQQGVGGALVGVRKKTPREPFAPRVGITAPVTSTLDFRGRDATLTLRDPSIQPAARVAGAVRPLNANFSAPLAYYPTVNETLLGLMGALRVNAFMSMTGLYMLTPYDPNRIPLIFVHGLISTPQMWRNVINEIEADPQLRGRYQCWVFAYPTGNPAAYSAMRLREELEKVRQMYGWPHGFVLVAHSMGGLLSHMQTTTLTRESWQKTIGKPAEEILSRSKPGDIVERCMIYDANPNARRVIFICTPHRGSDMAIDSIGKIAMNLIALPGTLAGTLKNTLGSTVAVVTGNPNRVPNGIDSLSPKNPTLKVLNSAPIQAPHHTILGDRGRRDSPHSSDGVVAYWSSHLDSAQSQKIVPGPHGSCELPQTINELKRILHLHLKTASKS